MLASLFLLCCAALFGGTALALDVAKDPRSAHVLYGWVADIAPASTDTVVLAVVTLRANGDDRADSVRGLVQELNLGGQKEVLSITLKHADYISAPRLGPSHVVDVRAIQRIPLWHAQATMIAHFTFREIPLSLHGPTAESDGD